MTTYSPEVEQWRPLVSQYFPPQLVDKALWVINGESGGRPDAVGDNGVARGLFQIQDSNRFANRPDAAWLDDPVNNVRYAAQQLGGANGDFTAWGDNGATYQGKPFGALGNNPYPGGSSVTQDPTSTDPTTLPDSATTGATDAGNFDISSLLAGSGIDTSTPDTTAASQLDAILLQLESNPPKASDFPNGVDANGQTFAAAQGAWALAVDRLNTAAKNARYQTLGLTTLPDGSVVSTGSLTPDQQAQIANANANAYAKILNQYGLDQYNVYNTATDSYNKSATQDFDNRVAALNAGISLDNHDLASAQANLQRWLDGQSVATAVGTEQTAANDLISKYGSPSGQTSFTPNDLGSGVAALAAQGGMSANAPILQYPGVVNVDPLATRQAVMASLGLPQTAPMLPVPAVTAQNTPPPQAPALLPPPSPPQFAAPTPYIPPPPPGPTATGTGTGPYLPPPSSMPQFAQRMGGLQ